MSVVSIVPCIVLFFSPRNTLWKAYPQTERYGELLDAADIDDGVEEIIPGPHELEEAHREDRRLA